MKNIPLIAAALFLLLGAGTIYMHEGVPSIAPDSESVGLAVPQGWHVNKNEGPNILLTKQVVLPEGVMESYAYGPQIAFSALPPGETVDDSGRFYDTRIVTLAGRSFTRMEGDTSDIAAGNDLTYFTSTENGTYVFRLYPLNVGDAMGVQTKNAGDIADLEWFIGANAGQLLERRASDLLTYTDSEFGFAFSYPRTWSRGEPDRYGEILLGLPEDSRGYGDAISVRTIIGPQARVEDAKFGPTTLWYDESEGRWMIGMGSDIEGISESEARPATPAFLTDSGLPVFSSTGRWATYIIPLSHERFLILNIGGSGDTEPLAPFAKTFMKVGGDEVDGVAIPELGIALTVGADDIAYAPQGDSTVGLTSKKLLARFPQCSAETSALGTLQKALKKDLTDIGLQQLSGSGAIQDMGDYYIAYVKPQSACAGQEGADAAREFFENMPLVVEGVVEFEGK